ncbi:TolC family protein [Parabacteroides bouchesdurhonensis]|uniref:TolC family protein n=1 Tax=Parabacteroides bouchesdurhonensis TaxID=1936995 RepID=UPI000C82413A|nr:TolC family protein [Parabacteroides bouchesdurhonensis]
MKKRIIFLLFLLFPVFTVVSQNTPINLSLQDAEKQFTEHNLELIAERYNIDIAEAQVLQAKLFENPVISLEQNVYNRLNGKYFDVGKEGEAAVEIEQLIYIAGQRNKRIRLEKLNKQMTVYQFEEILLTLRSELRNKFIELYYTQKSKRIYDREIESLSQILAIYKEQNEKGNISMMEKTRIQALLFSIQQERNDVDNQIISLQGDLKLLMGLKGVETFQPVFDESILSQINLAFIPFADLNARLYERPDVKLAQTNIQISEADVKLQKSLAFPEVSIKGMYDRAGNFINNYFAVGLNVSLPIFNRNQGNIKAAKISALQKNQREIYIKQQAEKELFTSYSRLEKALKLYQSSNSDLEHDFEIIMEGVNVNFRKRNISLLEFVDYYETYKESCLQLYQTKKEVFLAMEDVNTVTGSTIFNY